MEATPGVFGLLAIANVGLRLLDGTVDVLSSQPPIPLPGNPAVEVDVDTLVAQAPDEKEFGEMVGDGRYRMRRLFVVPGRRKHTVVYKQGSANETLELAHRIQDAIRTHSDQGIDIRILLGLDFAPVAKP
jgi:hypothetical protein